MKNEHNMTVSPFAYGEMKFNEVLHINGIPHLTRRAVGEFLEYAEPQKSIDKLIERNIHILEFQLPSVVTATDGKKYETFVYSPTGFLLIAMESGQPKAIVMKIAIAQFVANYTKAEPKPLAEINPADLLVKEYKLLEFIQRKNSALLKQANAAVVNKTGVDVLAAYGWTASEQGIVGQFWDYVDTIGLDNLNHSCKPELEIAVNLSEFELACKKAGLTVLDNRELRRAFPTSQSQKFQAFNTIHSRIVGRSIRCALFAKSQA